LSKAK